jgi:hypothetical protein
MGKKLKIPQLYGIVNLRKRKYHTEEVFHYMISQNEPENQLPNDKLKKENK